MIANVLGISWTPTLFFEAITAGSVLAIGGRWLVNKLRAWCDVQLDKWTVMQHTIRDMARTIDAMRSEQAVMRSEQNAMRVEVAITRAARHFTSHAAATYELMSEADGRVIEAYISPHFGMLTGLTLTEVVSNGWLRVVHPEHRDRVRLLVLSSLQEGDQFNARYPLVHVHTQQTQDVDHLGNPVRVTASGPIVGWVGCIVPMGTVQAAVAPLISHT